eukprot:scaffold98851_cov69-Phaeocystis_antarctica.AAC.2
MIYDTRVSTTFLESFQNVLRLPYCCSRYSPCRGVVSFGGSTGRAGLFCARATSSTSVAAQQEVPAPTAGQGSQGPEISYRAHAPPFIQ